MTTEPDHDLEAREIEDDELLEAFKEAAKKLEAVGGEVACRINHDLAATLHEDDLSFDRDDVDDLLVALDMVRVGKK